jgi:hypothetical protein
MLPIQTVKWSPQNFAWIGEDEYRTFWQKRDGGISGVE